MIELMIAIAVLAILAALLLSAVRQGTRPAHVASVVAEMGNLEKAYLDFRLKYDVALPSSMIIYEQASDWSPSIPSVQTNRARDILRRIWPDFDFTYAWAATPGQIDVNGDGDTSDTIIINGSECLVFFLGGMCLTWDGSGNGIEVNHDDDLATAGQPRKWQPIGFSTNPRAPFSREGTQRVGPFFTFDPDRLRDRAEVIGAPVEMPEYYDPLPNQNFPYGFASAARGCWDPTMGDGPFRFNDLNNGVSHPLTQVYKRSSGEPYNKDTFQLVSPGFDGAYGRGGVWESGQPLPSDRADERDNITNFAKGTLED